MAGIVSVVPELDLDLDINVEPVGNKCCNNIVINFNCCACNNDIDNKVLIYDESHDIIVMGERDSPANQGTMSKVKETFLSWFCCQSPAPTQEEASGHDGFMQWVDQETRHYPMPNPTRSKIEDYRERTIVTRGEAMELVAEINKIKSKMDEQSRLYVKEATWANLQDVIQKVQTDETDLIFDEPPDNFTCTVITTTQDAIPFDESKIATRLKFLEVAEEDERRNLTDDEIEEVIRGVKMQILKKLSARVTTTKLREYVILEIHKLGLTIKTHKTAEEIDDWLKNCQTLDEFNDFLLNE